MRAKSMTLRQFIVKHWSDLLLCGCGVMVYRSKHMTHVRHNISCGTPCLLLRVEIGIMGQAGRVLPQSSWALCRLVQ